jgi:hypothetical protein
MSILNLYTRCPGEKHREAFGGFRTSHKEPWLGPGPGISMDSTRHRDETFIFPVNLSFCHSVTAVGVVVPNRGLALPENDDQQTPQWSGFKESRTRLSLFTLPTLMNQGLLSHSEGVSTSL